MFRFLSNSLDESLAFLFSPSCPICELFTGSVGLCSRCSVFSEVGEEICCFCSRPQISCTLGNQECKKRWGNLVESVRSPWWLNEEAKRLLFLIKFQKRFEWMSVFRERLLNIALPDELRGGVLVPVPVHPKRLLGRGFNQTEILAHYLSLSWNIEVEYRLKKVKETRAQSQMTRAERSRNLIDSFEWDDCKTPPPKVILVDDVFTTGETVRRCASVLKERGAKLVFVWALFRTIPHNEGLEMASSFRGLTQKKSN